MFKVNNKDNRTTLMAPCPSTSIINFEQTYIYIYIYIYIYYPHTRVSCPGLISVAWVNEQRTTDVTRVLKTPGAELCQNASDERIKYFVLISVLQSAQ